MAQFHLTPAAFAIPGFPGADPVAGLAGGLLIGVAAAMALLLLGRIAGVSGIAARFLGLADSGMPRAMAFAFILGLPLGAFVINRLTGAGEGTFPDWPFLIIAGVAVGYGTRLGSGCTSGHGVCGMSRLSGRSLIATAVFVITGVVTVTAMRLLGLSA